MAKGVRIDFNIDNGHNQVNFPQFIYSGLSQNSVNDLCTCSSGMTINGSFTGQTCELNGLDDLTESIYLKITCEGCQDQTFLVAYPTPTPTPTLTPTLTQTITPTLTQSITPTLTPTLTQTLTPTQSITPTLTITPTINVTETITPTLTETITPTLTITLTPTLTPTLTITPTQTITPPVIEEFCYEYSVDTTTTGSTECPGYTDIMDTYTFTFKDLSGNTINAPTTFDIVVTGYTSFYGGGGIYTGGVTVTSGSTNAFFSVWTTEALDGSPGCPCPCTTTVNVDTNTFTVTNIVGSYNITKCIGVTPTPTPTMTPTMTDQVIQYCYSDGVATYTFNSVQDCEDPINNPLGYICSQCVGGS